MSNGIIRFAVRTRNETLWTPVRKALIFVSEEHNPFCVYGNHRVCNSLLILNNCHYHLVDMTRRYNMLQEKLVEEIKKHKKLKVADFRNNQTVSI